MRLSTKCHRAVTIIVHPVWTAHVEITVSVQKRCVDAKHPRFSTPSNQTLEDKATTTPLSGLFGE